MPQPAGMKTSAKELISHAPRGRTDCAPKPRSRGTDVKLAILPAVDPKTGIKHSRAGRWRAYSLAAVHVFMIAHVIHWLWAGETYTPIEPSESMETIRTSQINMGFLFFGAAILATMILGRWVCGWGCHLVAYQDLSLWVFKKLHLRPKAFRSRFLILVPLGAATWMFLYPLGQRIYYAYAGHPQPSVGWHLTRTGYWDTFPGPIIAIATVLVCGVSMIYFLGPKGFCTYACPYGAFFGIADKVAVARIRVTDDCHQCGHCTAVCTSNVNVAKEVNLYKMVVDPGCMKCLDCVEVCPNDALYVGFGWPALGAKPTESNIENKKTPAASTTTATKSAVRYDLTLGEELAAAVVFAASLFCVYGSYTMLPFLMSLGVAGVLTYLVIMGLRLIHQKDVLIQKVRLKLNSRLTPAGIGYAVGIATLVALAVHGGVWHYHNFAGNLAFQHSPPEVPNWQYDAAFVQRVSPEQKAYMEKAIHHIEACNRIGLLPNRDNYLELAWLYLFTNDRARAVEQVEKAVALQPNESSLQSKLASVQASLGDMGAARSAYEKALTIESAKREKLARKAPHVSHPQSAELWTDWATFLGHEGKINEARTALEDAVRFDPSSTRARLALAELQLKDGKIDDARRILLMVLRAAPRNGNAITLLESVARSPQDFGAAATEYRDFLIAEPNVVVVRYNLAHCYVEMERYADAAEQLRQALVLSPNSLTIRADYGAILVSLNDLPGAIREYEQILSQEPENAEASLRLGFLYSQTNRRAEAIARLKAAVRNGNESQQQNARYILQQLGADSENNR